MKKGISLVSLIITIIVLIILTATVIMTFKDNGIIDKAREATFKNDITTFKEELTQYVLNKQAETLNTFDKTSLNKTSYEGIKEVIKSFTKKYDGKVIINKGELGVNLTNLNDKEKQWATRLNLNQLSSQISNGSIPIGNNFISNYRIYGNSVQNGTPTPTNPIEVLSVGETSKNLFDGAIQGWISVDGTISTSGVDNALTTEKISANVDEEYVLSWQNEAKSLEPLCICCYNENDEKIARYPSITGTFKKITVPVNTSYIRAAVLNSNSQLNVQLERGSTATEYRPYRYIDVVSSGKNIWDEQWELGNIDNSTGVKTLSSNGYVMSKNYIKVQPNTKYRYNCLSIVYTLVFYYTENKTFIKYQSDIGANGFTTPENCYYILFRPFSNYSGDVTPRKYKNDICISLYDDNFSEYEPYQEPITTIELTGNEPLRKVGDVADYIDYEKGKIIRNVGEYKITGLENGIYSYSSYPNWKGFYLSKNIGMDVSIRNGLCTHYQQGIFGDSIKQCWVGVKNRCVYFVDSDKFDLGLDESKKWLQNQNDAGTPVTIYYKLEIPIEEDIVLPKLSDSTKSVEVKTDGIVQPSNVEIEYYTKQN